MTNLEITAMIQAAVARLFEEQPNIFDFVDGAGRKEWNLAHHIASDLVKALPGYDCDLEVTKFKRGDSRPDIIFHSRGGHENDYLVIEVKYEASKKDIERGIEKIYSHWFNHPQNYRFGAIMNLLNLKAAEVIVFGNSKHKAPL